MVCKHQRARLPGQAIRGRCAPAGTSRTQVERKILLLLRGPARAVQLKFSSAFFKRRRGRGAAPPAHSAECEIPILYKAQEGVKKHPGGMFLRGNPRRGFPRSVARRPGCPGRHFAAGKRPQAIREPRLSKKKHFTPRPGLSG